MKTVKLTLTRTFVTRPTQIELVAGTSVNLLSAHKESYLVQAFGNTWFEIPKIYFK